MMTDINAQEAQSVVTPTDEASAQADSIPEWVKDPTKAYEEIKKTREEAKLNRVKAIEFEKRLADIETQRRAETEAEARKKGNFETLLSQREKELAELRAQMEAERFNALRVKIGAEAGLPTALLERLKGATEDELRADALALKALIPVQEKATKGSTVTAPANGAKTGETYEERVRRVYGGRSRGNGNTTFG